MREVTLYYGATTLNNRAAESGGKISITQMRVFLL